MFGPVRMSGLVPTVSDHVKTMSGRVQTMPGWDRTMSSPIVSGLFSGMPCPVGSGIVSPRTRQKCIRGLVNPIGIVNHKHL